MKLKLPFLKYYSLKNLQPCAGYHGSLTTTSCIVTGRMEVKVANYGIQRIRSMARRERRPENHLEYIMLWEAPELLNNPVTFDTGVLQKADVYSYAIIAHEIFYEKGPFWLGPEIHAPSTGRLLESVRDGRQDIYGNYTRPFVHINDFEHCKLCNVQLNSAMQYRSSRESINVVIKCWEQNPNKRPDFDRIKKMRTQIMRTNLVDDLILRLQEYTDKLEQEVDRQTKHISDEKEKANDLVNTLLPRVVADELKDGLPSIPVEYPAVTIYQSDIQGFTSIGTKSEPIEILRMLRDFYKIFDHIISKFDAYKVETIGDAYVAVSGAPVVNTNHSSQMCLFALEIRSEIDKFKMVHLPNEKLRIRIGIHSGPIVGGVVGQSMPRWCLFGRAREICDKMESTGKSGDIQISEATYQELQNDHLLNWAFSLIEREETDMPTALINLRSEVSNVINKL